MYDDPALVTHTIVEFTAAVDGGAGQDGKPGAAYFP